jgi:Spy/CpxP family protein refolding chaperone
MTTKLIVMLGFLVAFAAGVAVGLQNHGLIAPQSSSNSNPTTHPNRRAWLVTELNLTPDQQQQLNQIWSETARRGDHETDDQRRQIRKQRDDAISALVHPEDKSAYEQIMKNYSDQMSALEQQWRSSFESAVERTKQILTPQQREKYEEILAKNQWDRRAGDRATTRPSPQ